MKAYVIKIILSLVISALSLCLMVLLLEVSYEVFFFKINEEIFPLIFAVLLFLVLILQSRTKGNINFTARGAMDGYLLGIVSYFAAQILAPGGIEIITNTLSQYGVLNPPFFLLILLPSFLSGGWLVGGFAFLLFNVSLKSVHFLSK